MHASRFSPQRGAAILWLLWVLLSAAGGTVLAAALLLDRANDSPWRAEVRKMFLPGATTHGHYQIELACETCHGDTFGGAAVLQDACVKCHGADLKEARDSHPKSKFTDPRNAERAAKLDATRCVTCHTEHRPQITHAAGLTLPNDYCVICHVDIGKDRPTHKGLAFDTCASSGCHNFHDNRALYEDFLVKHAREPALLPKRVVAERDFIKLVEEFSSYPHDRFPLRPVNAPDAADKLRSTPQIAQDWLASAHAKAGVNCSGCHADQKRDPNRDPNEDGAWLEKPSHVACTGCHKDETKGFLAGRHGMRLAASLPAMRPAHARLPMKADAGHETLGCTSCHGAHRFDTKKAAVDACLGCHDDRHTRAYKASPHAAAWRREQTGELPPGSGVTCATCHLPRVEFRTDDVKRVLVQHNQSNLMPSDKMVRPVCLSCHGLQFSLDALADRALVDRNFAGQPAVRIQSIDMALEAERRAEESRKRAAQSPPPPSPPSLSTTGGSS